MKIRRNSGLLIEAPAVATGDIAFNLLIFFLVCASSQPDSGRKQDLPRSEKQPQQTQAKNVEVSLTRATISVGDEGSTLAETSLEEFPARIGRLLAGKTKPEEKVVVVRSSKDTPYHRWIRVTEMIELAGGTITLQMQEEREVAVP
jgi:biopolymer transport protein ExbD